MVIIDERLTRNYDRVKEVRTLLIKESDSGFGKPFKTIPQTFGSIDEVKSYYPKKVHGTLTIHKEER